MTACCRCERRASLARVRRRRWWSLVAVAFIVAPVAWLPVVFAYTRLAAPMVAAIDGLDAATAEANRLSRAALAAPPVPSAPPPLPPAPPPAEVPESPPGFGIVKLSETAFFVDRSVIDLAIERQAQLMRRARVVPDRENGRVVGIVLFGVRPDTLLGLLGFENGDRLERINGLDVVTPERELEAYARFRTADELSVVVNRRGSKMTFRYFVV